MPEPTLKSRTIKGLIWSSIDKFAVLIISFLIGLILARKLMPADYGSVGMLAIFIAVTQLLVESGFSSALIQKHTPTNDDYSTVFYFNLVVSIVFYAIMFFAAPLIAAFYKTPELIAITRVLMLLIFINALSLVQQAKLTICLDFKTQAKVSVVSVGLSGVLGVLSAYSGYGVWSLVIQILSAAIIKTVLLFYYSQWMPGLVFSSASFKQLFRFSSNVLLAGLAASIVNNIYSIIIGKFFTAKELGYYTNGRQYPDYIAGPIANVLVGVTYPVLVSLKDDKQAMVQVYSRLMRLTVFFVMPILSLLALLAHPIVHLILTDKWMPMVSLMQWMCFARMLAPLCSLNMINLNVIGRSDLFLKVELFKLPFTVGALIITIPFGLQVVVIGHFITMLISFFITTYYSGKLFNYGALKQLRDMLTVIIATLLMAASVVSCLYILPNNDFIQLVVGGVVGLGVYVLAAFVMKIEELKDLKELVQKSFSSNNASNH